MSWTSPQWTAGCGPSPPSSTACRLCTNLVDKLVGPHAVDAVATGLASFGKGPGYPRRQPTHLPGMKRREEVVESYLARTGHRPDRWAFYGVFGLFRLAVIGQQIYFRYRRQTRNPAFKSFWILVGYFYWRCRSIIRRRGLPSAG